MYSSLPGVDVPHKLHWTPGEKVRFEFIQKKILMLSLFLSSQVLDDMI